MIILRTKKFMDIQSATIDSLKEDERLLRSLLNEKNKVISSQQNKIFDLERENRTLMNKVANLQSRQEGMVISYS